MCDFSAYATGDAEWAAVADTIPPPPDVPVTQLVKMANQTRAELAAKEIEPMLPQLHIRDHVIPTRDGASIEGRSYRPKSSDASQRLPVYLHFHGGGYLFGSIDTEDATCARIAVTLGIIVFHANYRHSPQWTYPTAWLDSEDAFEWIHSHMDELNGDAEKVVVGGISAGGQLSASLTLQQHLGLVGKSLPKIAGQVLMIPCVNHPDCYEGTLKKLKDPNVCSYNQCENAPILPRKMIDLFLGLLQIGDAKYDDIKLNIANATPEQVRGLPPSTFGIAGNDPLRDEALLYAKMLAEEGVPTDITVFPGLPHGFRRFGDQLSACKKWDETMQHGIRWALSRPTASGKFDIKT